MVKKVRKRDGRIVPFDLSRIEQAVQKALDATGADADAREIALAVEKKLDEKFRDRIPSVEEIQDAVEKELVSRKLYETAKAYIIYRHERQKARHAKLVLGVNDDVKLSYNAIKVLHARYLKKDDLGRVVETPDMMFRRVARDIAKASKKYGRDWKKDEARFYQMMRSLDFLPNSPTLMNAGRRLQQLAACFVVPIEDSLESIFDALKAGALIHQSGGGTGYSFSRLRPRGDIVGSTKGVASGPVSFMRIFDVATEVIKQGGMRRGANMGVLRIDHPDVVDFITAKEDGKSLQNFNISVAVTDAFMRAAQKGREYYLVNPRNGRKVRKLNAKRVLEMISFMAWETGDPGVIFLDRINKDNPTPELGVIEATNPCGEVPLLPWEACNLGSVNLKNMLEGEPGRARINWEKLGRTVRAAVLMLDNVIDRSKYPLPQIRKAVHGNRKIGLGVMGFADALIMMGIRYDSRKGVETGEKIMKFIAKECRNASEDLAEERGPFPNWKKSVFYPHEKRRNATLNAIAPTGSISTIAGVSFSIEPIYSIAYERHVLEGETLVEINKTFLEIARREGFYSENLLQHLSAYGSVQGVPEVPKKWQNVFRTALDIKPEWHVRMQAAWQKHVDNAVSKTINLPANASPEDVERAIVLAHKLGCKGVTVYRYGSKEHQVLEVCKKCAV